MKSRIDFATNKTITGTTNASALVNADINNLAFTFDGKEYRLGKFTSKEFCENTGFFFDVEDYIKSRTSYSDELESLILKDKEGQIVSLTIENVTDFSEDILTYPVYGINYDCGCELEDGAEVHDMTIYGVKIGDSGEDVVTIWGEPDGDDRYEYEGGGGASYFLGEGITSVAVFVDYADEYGVFHLGICKNTESK